MRVNEKVRKEINDLSKRVMLMKGKITFTMKLEPPGIPSTYTKTTLLDNGKTKKETITKNEFWDFAKPNADKIKVIEPNWNTNTKRKKAC
jgi:hypothetical protein